MNDLDHYLNRATRGLFGRRREALRGELRGNITQHALDLQIGGLGPQEALERALRDFGPPGKVSLGMLRVYTLPVLLSGLLIASGLSTVALGVAVHETASQTAPERCPVKAPDSAQVLETDTCNR